MSEQLQNALKHCRNRVKINTFNTQYTTHHFLACVLGVTILPLLIQFCDLRFWNCS